MNRQPQSRRLYHSYLTAFAMLWLFTAGCASEPTVIAAETGPREVQLAIDQGVVFSVGESVPGASYLKVDLVIRKNGSTNFDIKAGGTGPSDIRAINGFKTGGIRKIFASLDSVPPQLPSTANYGEYINRVKTGNGFVIANNMSDGYTRVWVKQVISSAGLVVLQYEAIAQ